MNLLTAENAFCILAFEEVVLIDDVERAFRAKKGSPFLSTEQAAFYLGLSPRKLQQMRRLGNGPLVRRHGRFVRYHIDDLEAWSLSTSIR